MCPLLCLLTGNARRGKSPDYPSLNWAELQRASLQGNCDAQSVASTTTLLDGTELTPQQLGEIDYCFDMDPWIMSDSGHRVLIDLKSFKMES